MEPPHGHPDPPQYPPPIPNHAPTLGYQQPGAERPSPPGPGGLGFLALFLIGAIGGAAISAVNWIGGWNALNGNAWGALLIVPGIKLAAGITFLCFRRWRGLGAGLMVSMALGFLIFFGTCMVHLNQSH